MEDITKMSRADLNSKYNKLGQGSSRIVYDAGDIVVKCARSTEKGLAQNETEYDIYRYARTYVDILCPVRDITPDNTTIVMDKAVPFKNMSLLSKENRNNIVRFKKLLKNMRLYYLATEMRCVRLLDTLGKENVEEIENSDIYQDIRVLINDYDLLWGDCFRSSSWGLLNGSFVMIDFGLTNHDYDRLYGKIKCA